MAPGDFVAQATGKLAEDLRHEATRARVTGAGQQPCIEADCGHDRPHHHPVGHRSPLVTKCLADRHQGWDETHDQAKTGQRCGTLRPGTERPANRNINGRCEQQRQCDERCAGSYNRRPPIHGRQLRVVSARGYPDRPCNSESQPREDEGCEVKGTHHRIVWPVSLCPRPQPLRDRGGATLCGSGLADIIPVP